MFAPLFALLLPIIYIIVRLKIIYGIKMALLAGLSYFFVFGVTLYYYLQEIIIGGEIILPISVIILRFIFALPSALIVLYVLKIFLDFVFHEDLEIALRLGELIREEPIYLLGGFNVLFLYIIITTLDFIPENLSIPWLGLTMDILFPLALFFITITLIIVFVSIGQRIRRKHLNLFIGFFVSYAFLLILVNFLGIAGATLEGYSFILVAFASAAFFIGWAILDLISKRTVKKRALLIIGVIVVSMFIQTLSPLKLKGKVDDAWNCDLEFTIETNETKFPIDMSNIRLVDRSLARDFAASYRLPRTSNYQLLVGLDYENIGLINGKPAWILPVYYAFSWTPKINYMVGYLYIFLDTPTFESMNFVEKASTVAPGLYGSKDLFTFALKQIPDGLVGEYYMIDPSPVTSSPAWVILMDKYSPWGVRLPYKVLIIGADGDYKVYNWDEAVGIVPQVVSRYAIESIIFNIGKSIRNGQKDYLAGGFIWIPASQDFQELLEDSFYQRSHHFLLENSWGRDFYLAVRTTGGEESVAAWILMNTSLRLFDLRFYKGIGGVVRGVNSPERALETIAGIIDEKLAYAANVRYPKLYRVNLFNSTFLIWVALTVQALPSADKPLGVAWVDASNPRIAGFVQYVYGESHDVFMDRLYENIQASYKGWLGENATTLVSTHINGTVMRKDWALLQPNNEYAIIMSIKNGTDLVTVIILETKVATKQDFYNAVLAQEGDWIEIDARWDIDLQAWVAYTVTLHTEG